MIDKLAVPPHIANGLFRIETAFELDDAIVVGMALIVRTERDRDSTKEVALF